MDLLHSHSFFRKKILFLVFVVTLSPYARAAQAVTPAELFLKIQANAALLCDAQTGQILFQKNINRTYAPASTVKLMTALLLYETKGLTGSVRIQKSDTEVEPSHVPLLAGETVSTINLIRGLLIGSDNDTAMALARHGGGSVNQFIRLMNERALALGCINTRFKNPNGLPAAGQYTTAADLLKIFQKAMSIPELRSICQTRSFYLKTARRGQTVTNHNKLLGRYAGMGPAKTGWTYASRHTYAASATRSGRELHLIILNSPDKWRDARLLFDYGFAHLSPIASPTKTVAQNVAPAVPTQASVVPAPSPVSIVQTKVAPLETVTYTVQKGDTLESVSKANNCSIDVLIKLNLIKDPSRLFPGQVILIPKK